MKQLYDHPINDDDCPPRQTTRPSFSSSTKCQFAAGRSGRAIFFQLVSARYERECTILTSHNAYGELGSNVHMLHRKCKSQKTYCLRCRKCQGSLTPLPAIAR